MFLEKEKKTEENQKEISVSFFFEFFARIFGTNFRIRIVAFCNELSRSTSSIYWIIPWLFSSRKMDIDDFSFSEDDFAVTVRLLATYSVKFIKNFHNLSYNLVKLCLFIDCSNFRRLAVSLGRKNQYWSISEDRFVVLLFYYTFWLRFNLGVIFFSQELALVFLKVPFMLIKIVSLALLEILKRHTMHASL